MTVRPGRPFWTAFTAFAANMVALLGMNALEISDFQIDIVHWWNATICSGFVAAAVYGKAKLDEKPPEGTQ
jgi:hypothetical protein